jgi:ABC-2 type transport system ATP-binding protein
VSKWYGPVIGVNQVTLELRPGVTGLVGANGAGKSTLMRLITGQLRPDIGRVTVKGFDAWGSAAKRHVGYCPETDAFYEEMSGRRFVETMARLCGYPRPEALRRAGLALEQVGMAGRAEHRLRGYSKGMRQRIKLAQALVHDPDVLVLDEPLSGIDPVGRSELVALFQDLSARGKCLLVSSHELDELEKLTDLVAIMARGCIAVIDTVARIRDRLDDHPLTIRIVVEPDRNGANVVAPGRNGAEAIGAAPNREFAAALLRLPDVVSVELLPAGASQEHTGGPVTIGERPAGGVLVRARNPQRFFRDLTRLALEEWYEIRHLETLDDSAGAVLGYLLGGSGGR